LHLNEKQKQFNQRYLEMLDLVLSTPRFYFSYTYDLTHNLQSLNANSPDFFHQTLVARADERYMWNKGMLELFQGRFELHKFCVPLVHGFVSINEVLVRSEKFSFILISRRSSKRTGTRLFSRGTDGQGNVSNFVETEQIVEYNGEIASFVQIRGSIPLYWSQKPNLKYKPRPALQQANHTDALEKHFDELVIRYFRVVCINLINQTGSEAVLEEAFRRYMETSNVRNVRYEAFDFHHECRNMQWNRLDILLNRLTNELDEFGFFLQSRRQPHLIQEGVFRTNCIDCLDRTNVVQGMLARVNLERVLKQLHILQDGERIVQHPVLEFLFKGVWADNGDMVSVEYSGTGALKSDFTRTGKRTMTGVMRDGYNSGIRYIKNNFVDGYRQDAMEVFLGNYKVKSTEGTSAECSPLDRVRDWKYYVLPLFLVFSAIMVTFLAFVPAEYGTEDLLYMLFWGGMVAATGGVILYHGSEYVDNPVLMEDPRPGN